MVTFRTVRDDQAVILDLLGDLLPKGSLLRERTVPTPGVEFTVAPRG